MIDISVKKKLRTLLEQYLSEGMAEEVFEQINKSLELMGLSKDEKHEFLEKVNSDIRELMRVSDYVGECD